MSDQPAPSDLQRKSLVESQVLVKADRPLARLALALLVVILVIYLLEKFSVVLQQFLIAVFIAYLLMPLHRWLLRLRIPSLFAYLLIAAVVIAGGTLMVLEVRERVAELIQKVPEYTLKFTQMLQRVTGQKMDPNKLQLVLTGQPANGQNSANEIRGILQSIIDLSTHAFVVIIYLLFLLAERASFSKRLKSAFPQEQADQWMEAVRQINASIDQYIYVKTFVSLLTGLFSGLALYALGVKHALLWGLLTFFLNYVPYLGALVAMVPPVLLSLVQFGSFGYSFLVLAVLSIIQNVIGYGIEPYMTGKRVDLSPLVLIASLAFWGALWGVVGMVLAVPFMVVIKAVLQHIPTTKPLAVLLSMRPPDKGPADKKEAPTEKPPSPPPASKDGGATGITRFQ